MQCFFKTCNKKEYLNDTLILTTYNQLLEHFEKLQIQ